jgi:predicted nucleotidyltransferase component of viral defense system
MTLDNAQHKTILVRILKDLFTDTTIGPYLGFKGGTAALLFYGLPRFSVDLDFDLLDGSKEEYVFERINVILQEYGVIKQAYNKRYNLFFLLSYHDKLQDAYNIKIEINKRQFGSLYELKQYLGIPMKVMAKEDMVAHKLVAMYERMGKTNRDIFDVWYFLNNNWSVNTAIIEKRTGMSYAAFLEKCIKGLEKMSDRGILSGIGELLEDKQKVWAKSHLRTETIFLLRLRLEHN